MSITDVDLILDCEDYSSERCPKAISRNIEVKTEDIYLAIVGCWGVYCNQGRYRLKSYDPDLDKLFRKEDLNYLDFFTEEKEDTVRGQESVVNLLFNNSSKSHPYNSLFLAGDNVYEYNEINPLLKDELDKLILEWNNLSSDKKTIENFNKHFISKKRIKKDLSVRHLRDLYKNVYISEQLSKGFSDCLKYVNTEYVFLGLGNHDIESCNVLNKQLNWRGNPTSQEIIPNQGKYLPGTYYNVVYLKNNKAYLNVIMIDTNMFEENPVMCDGNSFSDDEKNKQIEWFREVLYKIRSKFTIIIGHIPYKAIGHKKSKFIHNTGLNPIFSIVENFNKEEGRKVQAYFCADEHNQQLLFDYKTNLYLCVVGSGGTALDQVENLPPKILEENGVKALYTNSNFGSSFLYLEKDKMNIRLLDIDNKEFSVEIN